MSLSDVYRDRYYAPGYVYIAGSLSGQVIKIGTTVNISTQQKNLRYKKYGRITDWVVLYHVRVDEGGRVEHSARRILRRYRSLRMYEKDGSLQKGREIVCCSFSTALSALTECLTENQISSAWQSTRSDEYEYTRNTRSKTADLQVPRKKSEKVPVTFQIFKKIDELDLSIRTGNCLRMDGIIFIGELIQKTEIEMLRTPNFGRKSLNEIKEVLDEMGLHLGVTLPNWPPANLEQFSELVDTPYAKKVDELDLTVRSANCLKNDNILFIGDLVQKTEVEMLHSPNFGRKSLTEIKKVLAQMNLRLGMTVSGWPTNGVGRIFIDASI